MIKLHWSKLVLVIIHFLSHDQLNLEYNSKVIYYLTFTFKRLTVGVGHCSLVSVISETCPLPNLRRRKGKLFFDMTGWTGTFIKYSQRSWFPHFLWEISSRHLTECVQALSFAVLLWNNRREQVCSFYHAQGRYARNLGICSRAGEESVWKMSVFTMIAGRVSHNCGLATTAKTSVKLWVLFPTLIYYADYTIIKVRILKMSWPSSKTHFLSVLSNTSHHYTLQ